MELKPCPFCGSEAYMLRSAFLGEKQFIVVCKNKNCAASTGNYRKSRQTAARDWNRRANYSMEKEKEAHNAFLTMAAKAAKYGQAEPLKGE